MRRLLLCTDLDRTLIPNGSQCESPEARDFFHQVIQRPEVSLAFVTGRNRKLVEQAIDTFDLPTPDFCIADVGTVIYQVRADGDWHEWSDWGAELSIDWPSDTLTITRDCLTQLARSQDLSQLHWQEADRQSKFKASFYLPLSVDVLRLDRLISAWFKQNSMRANLIWSVDQKKNIRLLDILPARANKLKAIEYVMSRQKFSARDVLFAGDSGNDLDVFNSELPCVLVANAEAELKSWASNSNRKSLFVAQGGLGGMNGNYRAGIIEGVLHHWPESANWLQILTQRGAS